MKNKTGKLGITMKRVSFLVLFLVFALSIPSSNERIVQSADHSSKITIEHSSINILNDSDKKFDSNTKNYDILIKLRMDMSLLLTFDNFENEVESLISDGMTVDQAIDFVRTKNMKAMFDYNLSISNSLGFKESKVKVSDLTPFIYLKLKNNFEDSLLIAEDLAKNELIEKIFIQEKSLISELSISDSTDAINLNMLNISHPSYDGDNVTIGILDGGIINRYDSEFSFKTNITTRSGDSILEHATQVGAIAAGNNGVAPEASIVSATFNLGSDWYDSDIQFLLDHGADVINMSFRDSGNCTSYSDSTTEYLNYLVRFSKVTLVAATGNSLYKTYDTQNICSPAVAHNVISVGSTNDSGSLSYYSDYQSPNNMKGNPLLVAPGEDFFWSSDGLQLLSGTSYSSPLVAGAIALMMEQDPTLKYKPVKVMSKLLATANDDAINSLRPESNMYSINATLKNHINYYHLDDFDTWEEYYQVIVAECEGSYSASCVTENHYNSLDSWTGLRWRSGAGMLDLSKIWDNDYEVSQSFYVSATTQPKIVATQSIYVGTYDTVTIGVAWLMNSNSQANYALDRYNISLIDPNGVVVATANSSYSNLKKIEHYVTYGKSGTYILQIEKMTNYNSVYNDYISYTAVVN